MKHLALLMRALAKKGFSSCTAAWVAVGSSEAIAEASSSTGESCAAQGVPLLVVGAAGTLPGGAVRYSHGERAAQVKRFVFGKTLPVTWEGRELWGLERGFSVMLFDGMFCLFSLSRADCKFREGAHPPV